MAEFQEVMRQWRRMCADGKAVCRWIPDEDETKIIEGFVMAWAAKHQEPVYPTWVEWLKQMGVAPSEQTCFHSWLFYHIPADIAEKLGLQPKEGT